MSVWVSCSCSFDDDDVALFTEVLEGMLDYLTLLSLPRLYVADGRIKSYG